VVTATLAIGSTVGAVWGLLAIAQRVAPVAKDILSIATLYTTFAARDLADHGGAVLERLEQGNLPAARERVSWMVGRDTEHLDETGVTRAAVESVAENTVDGVLAPLFFAFLGGPVAAVAYKAMSTLDSTFGYRNEHYLHFGWASARLDDAANYLPARLAVPLIALAALFLGESPRNALRICRRDGGKHESPNAGLAEAAVAGALGVRLGGAVRRQGKTGGLPYFGDPLRPLEKDHIRRANALMFGATLAAALVFSAARVGLERLI
jgi:adenosylcobinamide-phosphate synthase